MVDVVSVDGEIVVVLDDSFNEEMLTTFIPDHVDLAADYKALGLWPQPGLSHTNCQ